MYLFMVYLMTLSGIQTVWRWFMGWLKSHSGSHLVGCAGMNYILFHNTVWGGGGSRFLQNMSNFPLESVFSHPRILSLHLVNINVRVFVRMQSLLNLIYCYNICGNLSKGWDSNPGPLESGIQSRDATHLTVTFVHMLQKQYWLGDWLNRQRFSHAFQFV